MKKNTDNEKTYIKWIADYSTGDNVTATLEVKGRWEELLLGLQAIYDNIVERVAEDRKTSKDIAEISILSFLGITKLNI